MGVTLGLMALTISTITAEVLITEFLADNKSVLTDEDGDFKDWIEIFNPDATPVDLGGFYLTDDAADLTQWQIPAGTTLGPSSYLVIFASDKDRAIAGAELHTNFKLSANGDYLALVDRDGSTVVSDFDDPFPVQTTDVSYGLQQTGNEVGNVVIDVDSSCAVHTPTSDVLGFSWTAINFNDSSWSAGSLGVGYERKSGYESLIQTDVEQSMYNKNGTVYIRLPFQLTDVQDLSNLTLNIQYDDGFAVYLNGTQVGGANASASLTWNSLALGDHNDNDAMTFQTFDLGDWVHLLQVGGNMLAIHGVNSSTMSSDMLIRPQLITTRVSSPEVGAVSYFTEPSPGSRNGSGEPLLNNRVIISEPSRTFFSPLSIAMSGAEAGQTIRYTTDGSMPHALSPEYTGTLNITGTTQIRSRVFDSTGASGPTSTETYLFLSSDLRDFKSNLPIIILDNFGGGRPDSKKTMFMAVIEPDTLGDGLAKITDAFQIATRGTMKVRGSSSSSWPKYSMSIEAWDGDDLDQNIAPLGFPAEADWVLGSKYRYDRALMRNDLAYRLSNDLGEYATRTRHVEVINNTGGGSLSYGGAYFGVYSLTEKIKRDGDRVDVQKILPTDNTEPEVTGGYLFKKDRIDPGDSGFTVNGAGVLGHVYPKENDISFQQRNWLISHLNEFDAAVMSPNWTHPSNGQAFTEYIKTGSWIKHHWINTLTMNVDGFRLSGYYYKDRLGKVGAGPVWDFDRTMESTDGRDNNPSSWNGTGDSSKMWGDNRFPWWGKALKNPDFRQRHTDMWQEERQSGAFSWSHIENVIDTFDAQLNTTIANSGGIASTAQARNFAKWTAMPPRDGSHAAEVTRLKNWLHTRLLWIDSQYTARPVFSVSPGSVMAGTAVSLTAGSGATIYYTTDGSDPRLPGGGVSGAASAGLPISINATTIITARARNGTGLTSWSGPVRGAYLVGPIANASNFILTEVHYAPLPPTTPEELAVTATASAFEYLELRNISATDTIDLTDVHFESGVDFTFSGSSVTLLAPGERVLLVGNILAFQARYGTSYDTVIAGQYDPDRLNNAGERLHLVDAFGGTIFDFTYNDQFPWPTESGIAGYSLVLKSTVSSNPDYSLFSNWRSSGWIGGNPDASDSSLLVGSPNADDDGDSYSYFLEHALGTSDHDALDAAGSSLTSVQSIEVGGAVRDYLTIRYQRHIIADDTELIPESSLDLVQWESGEPHLIFVSEVNQGDGTSIITYRTGHPYDPVTSPHLFLRLKASVR